MEFRERKISSTVEFLLQQAQKRQPVRNARVAAGLLFKGELVAAGFNSLKSHPFQKRFGKNEDAIFLHAENDCLINALGEHPGILDDLPKCTLLVVRSKKDSSGWGSGLAKPCIGCQRAIAHFGIKRVYFTNNEGSLECL